MVLLRVDHTVFIHPQTDARMLPCLGCCEYGYDHGRARLHQWPCFQLFWGIYLQMELLDHMVIVFKLGGSAILFLHSGMSYILEDLLATP